MRKAEVAGGGYVNVFLRRGPVLRELHDRLRAGAAPRGAGTRVIVEHTSINPNKAAHIGHLRNAVLGDTFVRVLRDRGREVGVQNYIDDTGVQVADVVVGFKHLEKKSIDEVRALIAAPRFDYYCWDLYARVGDFYAADPANKKLQAETLHEIEKGGNPTARAGRAGRRRASWTATSRPWTAWASATTCWPTRATSCACTSGTAPSRSSRRAGAIRLETEGKSAGCWVLSMAGDADEGAPAEDRIDEDKIIVRSNGTVTYTGKDIAYQLWKLGLLDRDFRYRRHRTYADGHVVWTTTSGEGEPGAPAFGHAREVFNVIDVGQSYPQRVVKAAVAALGHPEGAEGSHHLAYEKVVLSPATARALGYEVRRRGRGEGLRPQGAGGQGRRPHGPAGGQGPGGDRVPRPRARRRGARAATATEVATGALRYFLLKFGRTKIITFDIDEALAFTGETGPYVQNAIVRARSIFAKLEARRPRRGRAAGEGPRPRPRPPCWRARRATRCGRWSCSWRARRRSASRWCGRRRSSLLARHAFAVAQAFHSYYQKPRYTVLRAESEDARAFRVLVVDAFVRQMTALTALLGIPVPERM